jgi:hypothetical protein
VAIALEEGSTHESVFGIRGMQYLGASRLNGNVLDVNPLGYKGSCQSPMNLASWQVRNAGDFRDLRAQHPTVETAMQPAERSIDALAKEVEIKPRRLIRIREILHRTGLIRILLKTTTSCGCKPASCNASKAAA